MGNGGNWGGGTAEHTPAAIDLGTGRRLSRCLLDAHTCVILDNGDLKCWGQGDTGQNGNGNMGQWGHLTSPPSTAIDLGTGRTAVAVSAGEKHTCAILDNGDLKCWGSDLYGQMGDGYPTASALTPPTTAINLGTGRTAVAVYSGYLHICALLDNRDLKCWGEGAAAGSGSYFKREFVPSTALNLGTGLTAVAVSGGSDFTCALPSI